MLAIKECRPLTERQARVLAFYQDYQRTHGFWPSLREAMAHFGIRSTNGMASHIKAIQQKGGIQSVPGGYRSFVPPPALADLDLPRLAHELSPRQLEFLAFAHHYLAEHGRMPSAREILIALGLNLKSLNSITELRQRLIRKGYITSSSRRARAFTFLPRCFAPEPAEESTDADL